MSWNVTAVPHFATIGHIFEALPGAQIMHTISRFKAWEIRSPSLQTVCDLEEKWRSYGRLKTSAQSWAGISQPRRHLEGCFVVAKPLFGTRVPFCSTVPLISSCEMATKWAAKIPLLHKIHPPLRKCSKLQNGCEMISKLWNRLRKCFFFPFGCKMGCENISFFPLDSKWLQNDLQATKWPLGNKNDLQNEERFAKTLCKAKGSC